MNRSRKLVASVVLWPLPYPLVPSSYRCSVQQLIKDFETFWVLKSRFSVKVPKFLLTFLTGNRECCLSKISLAGQKNDGHLYLSGWVACRRFVWNFIRMGDRHSWKEEWCRGIYMRAGGGNGETTPECCFGTTKYTTWWNAHLHCIGGNLATAPVLLVNVP